MTTAPMGPRDVAQATGVSTDTLRHYERQGLLPRVTRTAAGYRQYSAATVDRVLLIQRALVVGFSLADLKRVLAVRDQGGSPCVGVRALVGDRLEQLNQRIEELLALRDELRSSRTGTADWRTHLRERVRTCSKRSGAEASSSKPGANGANVDRTMTMGRQWCVGLRPVRCKMTTSSARPIAIAPAT
jgi:DNA-binding transcriptional MerR regulator